MSRRYTNQRKSSSKGALAIITVLFMCILLAVSGGIVVFNSIDKADRSAPDLPAETRNAALTIAYSPEKATLLKGLAEKFNAKNLRTSDRQPIKIELVELKPDEMVEKALAGQADFQALTPDSSLWLDQLNSRYAQAQQAEPGAIPPRLAGDGVRYAVTPIVIAAWENSAKSLGWPTKPVGWTTLQTRARQDANFKWNHPSTAHASGLLATLAEFYAGAGVQRGLTAELAQKPKTLEFVNAVEKTVRFYGESELAVIQQAAKAGAKDLDAFVTPEQLVVAFNTGVFGKPPAKLIALYPAEGTLWADHPLALLETPELTANQRRTFQAFREYLASAEAQKEILRAGYRPADLSLSLAGPDSPLTAANGVDPSQPQTTLQLPPPDVVSVVQNAWAAAKRRTNVILVVDTSGSMRGDKLTNMQTALRTFLAQIPSDQERIGLVEFNSTVTSIIELDTLAKNRGSLTYEIDSLQANGNTAFLDAVRTAYRRLQQTGDGERINAIIAMTDGRENASRVTLQQLADEVRAGNQKTPVIIFSVAYGSDADFKALQTLAEASGGQVRAGTPETIRELYKILSSYF
ncbi:MAG: Ca-activated chloride channel [Chloroflexota bacterium]|nr:Ca-activated chloride channel [Chloroflexota bacterium]